MIIEIKINKEIIEHMIKEQELKRSECVINSGREWDWMDDNYNLIDEVSQEFLISVLQEYKKQKPKDYLRIKIQKKNE